jgi:general secretion pathway protein F
MTLFTYRALDANGRFISGEIEAADQKDVTRRLTEFGYVPLETGAGAKATATRAGRRLSTFGRRVSQREVTVFLRDLSLVLRAGLPIDEALQLLAGEGTKGISIVARDVRAALAGGAGVAEAMRKFPHVFGPDVVALVQVAEAAGTFEAVLDSIAEERARTEQLLDKVAAALRYPAFLLVASLSVLVFFLVHVVPQFAGVMRDFGTEDEGLVTVVLAISDILVRHGALIVTIIAALGLTLWLALRDFRLRRVLLRQVARIPGVSGIIEYRRTVLFCNSLGLLTGNGVTITETLRVLLEVPGALGDGLGQVAEEVRRGGRLVKALETARYLPPLALNMLRVGEETGELPMVARRTAEFYNSRLTAALERLSGIVGPAAILLIAVIIGGLVVTIMSALLSVNSIVS